MTTIQAKLANMNKRLSEVKRAETGNRFSCVSMHIIATEYGWSVYVDAQPKSREIETLERALEEAEAYVCKIENSGDALARTLGIAS